VLIVLPPSKDASLRAGHIVVRVAPLVVGKADAAGAFADLAAPGAG
jgi:hypothetical protein